MDPPAATPIPRRPLRPGSSWELSALTLAVDPPSRGDDGEQAARVVRLARAWGITTFDIASSEEPSASAAVLARAFPQGDPSVVVLAADPPRKVPPVPGGSPPRAARSLPGRPATGHDAPIRDARFRWLVEADAASLPAGPAPRPEEPSSLGAHSDPTVVRCLGADDVRSASLLAPPRLLAGAYSLLERELPEAALRAFGADGFRWIAHDPFCGGRLDGSRFAPGSALTGLPEPRSVRELSADFGSVAPLAFLVQPRTRTLAQAALRFVLDAPWSLTVSLPPPPPERWAEILGYAAAPPLTEEERRRAEQLTMTRDRGAPGRRWAT